MKINKQEALEYPWVTLDEVEENLRFLDSLGKCDVYNLSSRLIIHAHTPLFDMIRWTSILIKAWVYFLPKQLTF